MASDRPVAMAAVSGAHGIAGEVRLKLFGDSVSGLKRHKAFNSGALTLTALRDDGKGGAIARFAEVADRNGAEGLRGTLLTPGEYYHADLIGLPARTNTGDPVGTVIAVDNFGAGDVIEIRRADGKTVMVPMRPEAVPEWDDTGLVVTAAWVAD